jgi:hypothetical protein
LTPEGYIKLVSQKQFLPVKEGVKSLGMNSRSLITIGFSSHRIEMIPFAKRLMEDHDVIITEEAPDPNFSAMLTRKISIREYLGEVDSGFPEFSLRMYKLLRDLYRKGKIILQIEPYIENLMNIHNMFFDGKQPSDVLKMPVLREVYKTEKNATGALLQFYESSMRNSFQNVIKAVRNFSCADAERFRLRDTMRARAIVKVLPGNKKVYVEAGSVHTYLEKALRRLLETNAQIKSLYLLEPVAKKLTGKAQVLAPGDMLTGHYISGKRKNEEHETLLSARSLIYIQLLEKEEMIPSRGEKTPHMKDEIRATEIVNKLSLEQCEELYKKIRFRNRKQALEIIKDYLEFLNVV